MLSRRGSARPGRGSKARCSSPGAGTTKRPSRNRMTRILIFTLLVLAAAAGLGWLADRPGGVTVTWLGYQIETTAFVAAVAVGLLVVALILLWALLRYLFTRPETIAAHVRERRRQQGYDALSRGLLAIGVGDRA